MLPELAVKFIERTEMLPIIEISLIISVTSLHLTIMPRRSRRYQLMFYPCISEYCIKRTFRMINPLEPKAWSYGEKSTDDSPETFRKVTRLSQHISYLKDFFRAYKDFTDAEIDTIEIMLMKR